MNRQQELEIIIPKLREDISILGMSIRTIKQTEKGRHFFDQSHISEIIITSTELSVYCSEYRQLVYPKNVDDQKGTIETEES